MDKNEIPIVYIGEIPCSIAGRGKIMPGQTVEVPSQIHHNLVRDRNWKKIEGAGDTEIPAPVSPVSPVETIGSDGLDGLDISDESKEKVKRKSKKQEEV